MGFTRRFLGIFLPLVFTLGSIIVFRVLGTDHELVRPVTERVAGIVSGVAGRVVPEVADSVAAQASTSVGAYDEVTATHFRLIRRDRHHYAVPQIARGQSRQHDLAYDGRTQRFHSYHPRGPEPVPLLILFHGTQRDGLSMIDMWRRTAMREGFALLAPDAPARNWPIASPQPAALMAMVGELATLYPIDQTRIYLFGHSDGGGYAKILINGHEGPWRAAATHAGAISGLPREGLGKPVRAYIGDADQTVGLADVRQSVVDLARNGSDSTLVVIPGHTHWFYDIGPQIADDAWQWFTRLETQQTAAR